MLYNSHKGGINMAKKKALTETAVQNAVEAITEIAGADGKNGKKRKNLQRS